ncbi:MAG TPA: hypothetical protein VGN83_13680 [Falsiroseomonas sp.]|jgi:hypothetical protein|nr:hypothetical protein [Falsiroseomonas sp.]
MKLTDTQTQILAAAAGERQDRMVKPPAIPPGPRGAMEAKLRTAGLIQQVRLDTDEHPAMAWRHADGEAIGYRITEAGLEAIGVDAAREADMPAAAPQMAADAVAAPEAGTLARRALRLIREASRSPQWPSPPRGCRAAYALPPWTC